MTCDLVRIHETAFRGRLAPSWHLQSAKSALRSLPIRRLPQVVCASLADDCGQERPCTRCIKRNIGHLCHDEPREGEIKKLKNGKPTGTASIDDADTQSQTASDVGHSSIASTMGPPPSLEGSRRRSGSGFKAAGAMAQGNPMSLVQPAGATGLQGNGSSNGGSGNANQCELCFLSKFRGLCLPSWVVEILLSPFLLSFAGLSLFPLLQRRGIMHASFTQVNQTSN